MKLIFISDLHLSSSTPEKNAIFYQLLQSWQSKIDALYILGDFFDYWLGDDDITPFSQEMIDNLCKFSLTTPTYFRGGNHDFAIGKQFAKISGLKLIDDMHTIYTGKHKLLLSHGDTFCTLDIDYQKMKRIIQNPWLIRILLHLPLSWRYKIKEKMESGSKKSNSTPKPQHIYNVVDNVIAEYAGKYGADTVVHGHTHHPGYYKIESGDKIIHRYETPDWEDHEAGGYLFYDNGVFKFCNI